MKNKKDLIIAILITFCFTATLFMVIPTRSQPTQPYDSWLDVNEDGKIGPADFAYFSTIYGAAGDPTKNVNGTNFPLDDEGNLKSKTVNDSYEWQLSRIELPPWSVYENTNTTAGYRELSLIIYAPGSGWDIYTYFSNFQVEHFYLYGGTNASRTYPIMGSNFTFRAANDATWAYLYIHMYVTT